MSEPNAPIPEAGEEQHPIILRLQRDVTLARGTKEGAAWIGVSRLAAQVFQFAVSIVTARLLTPSEFGVAAITLSITAFAQLFTDLGIGAALIHAQHVSQRLISSAFWLNVITGFVLTLVISACAFPLAASYDKPQLNYLIPLAALNFTLACGVVQTALLERTMNFRQLALIESATMILGTAIVPVCALAGFGSASLVIGPLVTTITLTTALWISVRWLPSRVVSWGDITSIWRYSRGIVGFNAVNYWSRNLDNLALGFAVSSARVGEYARAYNLTGVPVQQMSMVVGRVLFPALSRLQHDPARLGKAWLRGLSAAAALTMPVSITLALTADALVPVLYGERWSGMVPVLTLLALGTLPQIIASSTGSVFRAIGRTGLLFRLGLISAILSVVAILAGLPWGTVGVSAALLVKSWVTLPIAVGPLFPALEISMRELWQPTKQLMVPCFALAAGELAALPLTHGQPDAVVLLTQLACGGLLYLVALWRMRSPALELVRNRVALGRR